MSHRQLSNSEITALQNQGCFSSDWSKIEVSESFSTDSIYQVRFMGNVKLGKLGGPLQTKNGETLTSGLYSCKIDNCEIGDDVLLDGVQLVKNYKIKDRVIIEHVHSISVNAHSSFGNGFEIEVLNEGGGRELKIFDKLSAQLAYILVSYRHNAALVDAINGMIDDYAGKHSSGTGTIGSGTEIINAGTISEVNIGECASIDGASLLKNGTIVSNKEAPASVGENVIAKNFIMLSGSKIDGGALVDKSFVGQGVKIGKQFSAENSVFFANSEAFHGEAVSIFAGPYTVTHHKSSLLIAGMYSFFNAGSGTNQSNHMYKLGPVHQGILERGSKTGSFAYLLWPCRIGAFSVVMGKNLASFDTSDFPFSYINVDNERSILTPGMNLFTVGTRRDSEKWPLRDKRKDPVKLDLINFEFLSPYIIQKVLTALDVLQELYDKASKKQETVFYKGIRIKRLMLKSTRKFYDIALNIFLGDQVIRKLEKLDGAHSMESIRKELAAGKGAIPEKWLDLSGMIASEQSILQLLADITSGNINTLEKISSKMEQIHAAYEDEVWNWTTRVLAERLDLDVNQITADQLLELINRWESETIKLDKMILGDAAKEFDNSSKIGFGLDGDEEVRDQDFEAVRGVLDENKFIKGIHREIEQTELKASKLKEIIQSLQD
jgi:NDP-sugar pyrophosphorylase family protein